jgi:hypothetical protein
VGEKLNAASASTHRDKIAIEMPSGSIEIVEQFTSAFGQSDARRNFVVQKIAKVP